MSVFFFNRLKEQERLKKNRFFLLFFLSRPTFPSSRQFLITSVHQKNGDAAERCKRVWRIETLFLCGRACVHAVPTAVEPNRSGGQAG
jgi:hypothetical protein